VPAVLAIGRRRAALPLAAQAYATGAALLFFYALGYVAPLGAAAAGAGAARRALAARAAAGWVPAASGALLVCGGTFGLLSRLVPS
jgi:cytochrome c-type biogenesis protein